MDTQTQVILFNGCRWPRNTLNQKHSRGNGCYYITIDDIESFLAPPTGMGTRSRACLQASCTKHVIEFQYVFTRSRHVGDFEGIQRIRCKIYTQIIHFFH